MHTRQGVAVPAPSQDSARPFRIPASRFEAIDVINRLHGEALQITAAARTAGRFSPAQCARLRQINDENARARDVLNPPLPSIAPEPLLSAATGMYPREVNLNGTTRHSRFCKATPRRRDWSCHRCCELMKGAAPRGGGWQRSFFGRKLGQRNFLFGK